MMKEIKATVLNKTKEGIIIGIPPSMEAEFKTSEKFRYGQTVWVAYDFSAMQVVSVSATQSTETPSHNNVPEPTAIFGEVDEIHPITEEEEWLEVDDITYPEVEEEGY